MTAGNIYINGKDITALKEKQLAKFRREELGFIFQDFNLLDTLTVRENIALGLTILGKNPKFIKQRVGEVAKMLEIENCLEIELFFPQLPKKKQS